MPLACPVCRAEIGIGPACRRCRADLTLVLAVETDRDRALDGARRSVARGDLDVAAALCLRVATLRRGHDADSLGAVIALLHGDWANAWTRARTSNGAAT